MLSCRGECWFYSIGENAQPRETALVDDVGVEVSLYWRIGDDILNDYINDTRR